MKKLLLQTVLVLTVVFALTSFSFADPVLPHLISDHMVLQQGQPIHIWGKADPKEKITVALSKASLSIEADGSGNWSVDLPAMHPGGPFSLTVHGNKDIIIKDVMVGEVWIASGQSNMTFALNDSLQGPEEVSKSNYPELRLFNVPKRPSNHPEPDTLPASWQICSPDSSKEFSAVAYYFARDLHRKLRVPIGIIESAWPGTAIEQWIEPAALKKVQAGFSPTPAASSSSAARQPFDLEFDDFQLLRKGAEDPEQFSTFDDGTSRDSLGGYWSYSWDSAQQTSFNLVPPGHNGSGFAARVAGGMDASDDSRLVARFHIDDSPVDLSAYAGIQFWVRGNGSFRVLTRQPTITDWDDYSSHIMQASDQWNPVVVRFSDLHQDGWGVVEELTVNSLTGFVIQAMPKTGYPPLNDSDLFNGMIAPLMPYKFRGAIWYQGEGNALSAFEYRQLLPTLIKNWRDLSNSRFPFLIVQLPNHGAVPKEPTESAWAELREAEFLTERNVPDTGLAVTIDVGDPKNLHPHRKMEVGQRLALWALGTTYGENITYSGPLYQSMKVEGSKIVVKFSHVGGGLVAKDGPALVGFSVAGPDRNFHWADAAIQGDSVVVSSNQVPDPVAVRYAWGDSPDCNLFNKEGLPASPFRTDDWPGITGPKVANSVR
jgi:sialate O-acetylesterase